MNARKVLAELKSKRNLKTSAARIRASRKTKITENYGREISFERHFVNSKKGFSALESIERFFSVPLFPKTSGEIKKSESFLP